MLNSVVNCCYRTGGCIRRCHSLSHHCRSCHATLLPVQKVNKFCRSIFLLSMCVLQPEERESRAVANNRTMQRVFAYTDSSIVVYLFIYIDCIKADENLKI